MLRVHVRQTKCVKKREREKSSCDVTHPGDGNLDRVRFILRVRAAADAELCSAAAQVERREAVRRGVHQPVKRRAERVEERVPILAHRVKVESVACVYTRWKKKMEGKRGN